jgi:hypothetical protein
MQREVCLKHRNNRREIILRVRTQIRVGSGVCSFLSYAARASQPAPLICGYRSRAGLLSANQVMPVQFRLTAPIFRIQPHGGRQLAQQSLQNSAGSGQHRDAVPFSSARSNESARISIARGKPQGGRVMTHGCARPANRRAFCRGARWEGAGLISRKRAGSIPAPATNFQNGPLDHSGGHPPCKRESTVQSRGGPLFQIAGRLRTREVS